MPARPSRPRRADGAAAARGLVSRKRRRRADGSLYVGSWRQGAGPFPGLNGIAIDKGSDVYVSLVAAAPYLLRTVVAGLNDPSSGAVVGNRVYFTETKFRLLTERKDAAAVPRGVPFNLQSYALPSGD